MRLHISKTPNMKKIALVTFLLSILLTTIQLINTFVPRQYFYADKYYLARLFLDRQNFPVDAEPIGGDNTTIIIKTDEKLINNHLLNMEHILDERKYDNDPVLRQFMPIMSIKDQVNLLDTLETFVRICEQENLTYFLSAGTLLGAYRHHGFVPWDDDIDLIMRASDWRKIRNVLSRVQGYRLLAPGNTQWKFFKTDLAPIPGEVFMWPFVDIFFFLEDSTHAWGLTDSVKPEIVNPIEEIFPLQLRPFEHLQVTVPCKTEQILIRTLGIEYCHSPKGAHKDSEGRDSSRLKTIPCTQLYSMFPFVFREKDPVTGNIFEVLKIGDKILRNISVPQSCTPER